MPTIDSFFLTDPGQKRANNEDAVGTFEPKDSRQLKQSGRLYVVADGLGGHQFGERASQYAVENLLKLYFEAPDIPPEKRLRDIIQQVNQKLIATARRELASGEKMATTVVAAVVRGDTLQVANVGDSRAYLIRGRQAASDAPTLVRQSIKPRPVFFSVRVRLGRILGGKRPRREENKTVPEADLAMQQLSYDHSVVADQIRAGKLTPLQALRSPKRNRLTQSLTPRRKEINPFFYQAPFSSGDILLLCTDGLWGVVSEAIVQAVALELPPQEAAEKLVALTLASGAPDNVTVVIARRRGVKVAVSYDEDETNPGV